MMKRLEQIETDVRPENSSFGEFLRRTHCDLDTFWKSLSEDNDAGYFYLGDLRENLFCISDNMQRDFGFRGNVVRDLPLQWSRRIGTPEFRDMYLQDMQAVLRDRRTVHDSRYRVKDARGNPVWVRERARLKWSEDGAELLFVAGRITCQERHFVVDPITNLPRAGAAVEELRGRAGEKTLLIGIGLKGVGSLNSIRGRASGDRLMGRVADALMTELADKMAFFRLEGAHYMALVNPAYAGEGGPALVRQITRTVQRCYEEMAVPAANPCFFGLLEYTGRAFEDRDVVEDLTGLIHLAEKNPEKPYLSYSQEGARLMRENSRMALELDEDVLEDMKRFRVMVQPIVSAHGPVLGGEVLLRWNFDGQEISPADFVPLLEKGRMIRPAGRWVLRRAVELCARMRAYNPAFFITVNVSLYQLSDEGLLPALQAWMQQWGVDGTGLVVELTESCLDEEPEKLRRFVDGCEKLGVAIALDDFGSGYSSLRMLLQYPLKMVKLDRDLVQATLRGDEKQRFMRSIVYACHQFGKIVCAEGVEEAWQDRMVCAMGCDMIQGFYHHRPLETEQMEQLVAAQPRE